MATGQFGYAPPTTFEAVHQIINGFPATVKDM